MFASVDCSFQTLGHISVETDTTSIAPLHVSGLEVGMPVAHGELSAAHGTSVSL
jgi:hypothetical protein